MLRSCPVAVHRSIARPAEFVVDRTRKRDRTSRNQQKWKKGEVPGPRGRIAPSILSLRHLPETERRVDLLRAAQHL
jgi:hypothetical protein